MKIVTREEEEKGKIVFFAACASLFIVGMLFSTIINTAIEENKNYEK